MHILLAGNPNCGKTTLFNALTGENQRVGNWPGVTVEKKTGQFMLAGECIELTDLPGVYTLSAVNQEASIDELIAAQAILSVPADLIINVVDAAHLERHLYLTSQLLELNKPVIIALNMVDVANQRGITVYPEELAQQLGCPVIPIQSHKKIGITELLGQLQQAVSPAKPLSLALSPAMQHELQRCCDFLQRHYALPPSLLIYHSLRLLEGSNQLSTIANAPVFPQKLTDADILLADARYQRIHEIAQQTQKKQSQSREYFTAKLDRIVLHRFLALPIFLLIMYCMFLFAINIGGAFQDFFDISTDALFVHEPAKILLSWHAPAWLVALLANGVGMGINTTLTFIPVIAAMYFFLALLESSGYMARAAFVVDKLMRLLGLPGKSFVPMIVGFGCNVPAIMAARTLDTQRDRLLTVLMAPFMSCSARLAIYAVFVAAFFPAGGQNVVFALYVLGILMAVLTGLLLRKTALRGDTSPLVLELPAYHWPSLRRLSRETGLRLKYFVLRAGRLIIPVCILLGGLNALTIQGSFSAADANTQSLLSILGQWLTPIFAPMGLHQDNWPATVGLLTGMLAKEVVVGSLNTLYAQLGHLGQISIEQFDLWASLRAALWSIPHNLAHLADAFINPILASAPESALSHSVYGLMAQHFDGPRGAFAYLLFILLYIPCVSTMAAIRQETDNRLMWFSVIWSLLIAYSSAVIFYQLAFFTMHPLASLLWVFSLLFVIGSFVLLLYKQQGRNVFFTVARLRG